MSADDNDAATGGGSLPVLALAPAPSPAQSQPEPLPQSQSQSQPQPQPEHGAAATDPRPLTPPQLPLPLLPGVSPPPALPVGATAEQLVAALAAALRRRGWRVATAESCTGGLIAAACTALAGSSEWFDRGFVTYSNDAKTESIGVPAALIEAHGAVSEAVACAMAKGALRHSRAQLAVAVTGIAGPGGATPGKPVGTVWLALAGATAVAGGSAANAPTLETGVQAKLLQLTGDRAAVRAATVEQALRWLLDAARV